MLGILPLLFLKYKKVTITTTAPARSEKETEGELQFVIIREKIRIGKDAGHSIAELHVTPWPHSQNSGENSDPCEEQVCLFTSTSFPQITVIGVHWEKQVTVINS